jgi:transcriptional regulator with XRE-family HTH domain
MFVNRLSEVNRREFMTFAEKLLKSRLASNLSQIDLAQKVGINPRTIYTYEQTGVFPRRAILEKLAATLDVTVAYLMDEDETDTQKNLKEERFISKARKDFGYKGAKDAERLIEQAAALFAGGELDDEGKDLFFQSLTEVYFESKAEAREKFTPKRRVSRKK